MNNKIFSEVSKIEIPDELSARSELGVRMAKNEMGSKSNKRWMLIAAPAIAAIIAFSAAGSDLVLQQPPKNPEIQNLQASYAFDISDHNQLVGWADNVFVGKVIEAEGTSNEDGMLETQFRVEVAENIKGHLEGMIIVNQQGGYEGNKLLLVENDQLLKEGESYLFISRHNNQRKWHSIVPVYGDILINNESHRDELIITFKSAYENEIPYEGR
ncbi:hypothetical protein [Mesobacillus jeotgali]|uniref:hypothetical protein n=1 Tax=Mesobacillus jeotgali TaxID=129985 RepID=UPI0009A87C89|nr:hypothetical protein [Mesobacillus jeotgali]